MAVTPNKTPVNRGDAPKTEGANLDQSGDVAQLATPNSNVPQGAQVEAANVNAGIVNAESVDAYQSPLLPAVGSINPGPADPAAEGQAEVGKKYTLVNTMNVDLVDPSTQQVFPFNTPVKDVELSSYLHGQYLVGRLRVEG